MNRLTLVLLAALAACNPPPAAPTAVPGGEPGIGSGLPPLAASPHAAPSDAALVWWTVPAFAPAEPDAAGAPGALEAALDAYRVEHPAVDLRIGVKPAHADQGITAQLKAAARAAPAALPDLAVVPLDALLDPAVRALAQPWPDELALEPAQTFPFAATGAWDADGRMLALPFAVDSVHLVSRGVTPPATWAAMQAAGPWVVPAPTPSCRALSPLLAFYAASGGVLSELPDVDPEAWQQALAFIRRAAAGGSMAASDVIDPAAGPWQALMEGEVRGAAIAAAGFLRHEGAFPELAWGPLPGPERPVTAVGCGWAMVIATQTPQRAVTAASLARWLTAPERRTWVVEAGYLPAEREEWAAAVSRAVDPSPETAYLTFLEAQLAAAAPVARLDTLAAAWSVAYEAALAGDAPPAGFDSPP